MSKYSLDMSIGEVLSINPDARAVLEGFGMHCIGCPVSQMETLDEACEVHGIDSELLLKELNDLPEMEEKGCGCGSANCDCGDDCTWTPEDNCGCDCGSDKE